MAVDLDYLTYEDVVEDQREDAEIYHNTQLKINKQITFIKI